VEAVSDRDPATTGSDIGPFGVRDASHKGACRSFQLLAGLAVALAAAASLAAAPASDSVLPNSTKAYVSIAQPTEMKARWKQTQLGRMLDDEIMRPFVEDVQTQLDEKFSIVEEKLGIVWEDLDGVPGGELSFSMFERSERAAALVLTIDVTGRRAEADKLLASVERRFTARGASKSTIDRAGAPLTVYTLAANGNVPPQQTVYFIKDDLLCGVDDLAQAEAILHRFSGAANDNLLSVAAYRATMDKCRGESQNASPELRWYVEPFDFIFAARTLQKTPRNPHDKDYVKILSQQGFDAIRGVGGFVNLLAGDGVEVLHRTAIHAPPLPGKENDPLRWELAMRMLQLPNGISQEPQSWVPRSLASYTTFHLDTLNAFDHVGSLIDAIRGHENAWETTLRGWRTDPFGAKIDLRGEAIVNLGNRITIITDYLTPITVNSERSIVAIEAKDEAKLALAVAKWMKAEPDRKEFKLGDVTIWERVSQEELVDVRSTLPPVFGRGGRNTKQDTKPDESEPVLPNSAVTVALGHFMMATDVDYLKEILAGFAQRDRLAGSEDFQEVMASMNRIAPGRHSGWSFVRLDEQVRPTYELVRQGKMPQSKTMLGKALNELMLTDAEQKQGVVRKQEIDGSTLPSFEAVRRYFGPAGRALRSDPDGWVLSGAILTKGEHTGEAR
jgi:hypothetical protein